MENTFSALEFGRDRITLTNLLKMGYLNFPSAFLVAIIVFHASSKCKLIIIAFCSDVKFFFRQCHSFFSIFSSNPPNR